MTEQMKMFDKKEFIWILRKTTLPSPRFGSFIFAVTYILTYAIHQLILNSLYSEYAVWNGIVSIFLPNTPYHYYQFLFLHLN